MEKMQNKAVASNTFQDIISNGKSNEELEEFESKLLIQFKSALEEIKNINFTNEDVFLMRFLRTRKYNVAAAVKNVIAYIDLIRQNMELLSIPFSSHEKFYDSKISMILKQRDEHGRRILVFRISKWDSKIFSFNEMIIAQYLLYEELTTSIETQKRGIFVILDAIDITLSHAKVIAKECSIKNISKMLTLFQGAFPAKFKGIIGIGIPLVLSSLYGIAKFLLKAKLRNRLHITSSGPQFIHSHINPNILPDFLEGNLSCEEAEDKDICKTVLENEMVYKGRFENLFQKWEDPS